MRFRCYKCQRKKCRGVCDCAFKGRQYAEFDARLWATCPVHDGRPVFRFGQCRCYINAFWDRSDQARRLAKTQMVPGPVWDELKEKQPELWDKYK